MFAGHTSMNVAVAGLWHLGSVTAACLAAAGHRVTGIDPAPDVVNRLATGKAPVHEPGLDSLIASQIEAGRLRFTADYAGARQKDVLWVTFDTPVDENDHADTEYVVRQIDELAQHASDGALVLISSQLPVGTTAKLVARHQGRNLEFCYSPENLRLGQAIDVFNRPGRIVVGVRSGADRTRLQQLLKPFGANIEWMRVESAEMAKHALNAFLATSVSFINEVSAVSEDCGADGREVERALKTDERIGPRAYLRPGAAFAGGTLARDLRFLEDVGRHSKRPMHLIKGVLASNQLHKEWLRHVRVETLGSVDGKRIAVLGLAYKPGTNTLRRSASVEACIWLRRQGAAVRAWDPAVKQIPGDLLDVLQLCDAPEDAFDGAVAAVIATEWPELLALSADNVVKRMARPLVVDASRYLEKNLGADPRIEYRAVGLNKHAS
jgi:UDPglucose 6-dehydrogenase